MRVTCELTEEQHARLIAASQPVPYLVFGDREPASPTERTHAVWRELGEELGFDWETARPISGMSDRWFDAERKETP